MPAMPGPTTTPIDQAAGDSTHIRQASGDDVITSAVGDDGETMHANIEMTPSQVILPQPDSLRYTWPFVKCLSSMLQPMGDVNGPIASTSRCSHWLGSHATALDVIEVAICAKATFISTIALPSTPTLLGATVNYYPSGRARL